MTETIENFRQRLSANAEDFDGIVAQMLATVEEQEKQLVQLREKAADGELAVERFAAYLINHHDGEETTETCIMEWVDDYHYRTGEKERGDA